MANIYSRLSDPLFNITCVYHHMRDNSFTGLKKDLAFDIAFRQAKQFLNLSENKTALFCCIFYLYFETGERPVNLSILSDATGTNPLRFLEFRDYFDALEELGYIVSDKGGDPVSFSKNYRLSEEVTEAILKGNSELFQKVLRPKNPDLTYPEDIIEKELFYMDEIKEDVHSLFTYLKKDKFKAIQSRLVENKMNRGVCIMLHGDSGTGKTETVYQLAKKTDRAIYHVDIGATISQWVGGTEQNLSEIFKKYKKFCKQARTRGENMPILLFNEADALFGRRLEHPMQGSEVESNHIQSLLLDYLERQEGILIVTTNLAGSFDEAFERRFLFKIKFEKPNIEIKKRIWKSKVSWLAPRSVERLASSYALSGGEIDNVVRKATMNEVLTGNKSTVSELENLCQKEKLESARRSRIGFM